ncbi:MAG: hypothetical protein CL933_12255 [Deltaproteobacteria bacterium]|nr:hypothetical protein [Deltaproteobacteria bacterium]
MRFTSEIFSVLSHTLGDRSDLFGKTPSSVDAFLFTYTYAFLAMPFESPTRTLRSPARG